MLKVVLNINKKNRLEAENILFETAPHNWVVIFNRQTKQLTLEGVFPSKDEAEQDLSNFKEFISKYNNEVEFTKLDNEWEEAYKDHFKPWSYKSFNFIPEWEKSSHTYSKNNINIYIDPGMAFGTGTHETTRLCIELMIDSFIHVQNKSNKLLDIGCGSGILSILGQFLGFESIDAIDNDINAIQNSIQNISLNFNDSKIQLECKPISAIENNEYDCVVANIQSDILINYANKLIDLLNNKGQLILSGILNYEVEDVDRKFNKLLQNKVKKFSTKKRHLNEWCAIQYKI